MIAKSALSTFSPYVRKKSQHVVGHLVTRCADQGCALALAQNGNAEKPQKKPDILQLRLSNPIEPGGTAIHGGG
jgi:hypothetical protein